MSLFPPCNLLVTLPDEARQTGVLIPREIRRVAATQLQRHRVLLGVVVQESLAVAVDEGAGSDHLRVKQRLPGEQAPEPATVVV